jgi:hypothetical protein
MTVMPRFGFRNRNILNLRFAWIRPVDGWRGDLFASPSITLSSFLRTDGARRSVLSRNGVGAFLAKMLFCKKAGTSGKCARLTREREAGTINEVSA